MILRRIPPPRGDETTLRSRKEEVVPRDVRVEVDSAAAIFRNSLGAFKEPLRQRACSYWSGRDGITNLASSGSFRETACAEASLSVVGMWSVRSGPDPTGPVRLGGGTAAGRPARVGAPPDLRPQPPRPPDLAPLHDRLAGVGGPAADLVRGGPNVDSRAVFYARYENAFGKLWETLNPADPRVSFKVRRAWLLQLRNWYQRRRRRTDERIVERRNAELGSAVHDVFATVDANPD